MQWCLPKWYRKAGTAGVAAVLAGAGLVAGAGAAHADPGDAEAAGLHGTMRLATQAGMTIAEVEGDAVSVSAPPSTSERARNVMINRPLPVSHLNLYAKADLVEASATSTSSRSAASARLEGIEVTTPGGLLKVDAAGSQVSCPVDGKPSVNVTRPTRVTLGDEEIDPAGPNRREVIIESLGNARAFIDVDLGQRATTTSSAAASAVVAKITVNIPGRALRAQGVVSVAPTSCESPTAPRVAPTASELSPESGPTEGGTEVTITGENFVPGDTEVKIGDKTVPADEVTVADEGTSLSFYAPAHTPGKVEVVVTTPGGSTEPLTFTYEAPPAPAVYSGPQIAFQANTADLWTTGMWGAHDTNLGMMPGTSPSLAVVNGGYQVAFQANTGRLWTTGALGTYDLGLGMAPGTSPSITAVNGGAGYQIAFQANSGRLWSVGALGGGDMGLGMAAGTSPSITTVGGGYQVAFQANTTSLWTAGAQGTGDRGLGMAAGTSPSITTVGGGYQVAFQANTTSLWTTGAQGTRDRGLGMAAKTSPSITAVGSGYQVAFQANTTSLWSTGSVGTVDTRFGMMRDTSPDL